MPTISRSTNRNPEDFEDFVLAAAPNNEPVGKLMRELREPCHGRAVLILDARSLRGSPWIIHGAAERGFTIHDARATGVELPADTTSFAKALGFSQRWRSTTTVQDLLTN
ncbi:MAG: hypothetical protein U9O82_04525 [Thermodesulfobacteriota bacterium]|nr:hypothetical protein [Thermodesulfobacteriota bacterium]